MTCTFTSMKESDSSLAWLVLHLLIYYHLNLGIAGGLAYANNLLVALPVGLLGLLLLFQVGMTPTTLLVFVPFLNFCDHMLSGSSIIFDYRICNLNYGPYTIWLF
jgi:hypothetical protein